MAETIYRTQSVTGSPQLLSAAMEDVRLIGEAFEPADPGPFSGIVLRSLVLGEDGVYTWTFSNPIPDDQLVQFSFA